MKKNNLNTLFRVATMNVFILHQRFISVSILITGILLYGQSLSIAQPATETGIYPGFADTIIIGSEPDYPPYCIVDENGNASGFSVDLFNAAARATELNVIIKIGVWNQIKQDLAEGKIDALPLVGRTPEREELFDFTMPYLSLHGAVFARKETKGISSFQDLKGKEIVVMKGDNAEEFVRRENISDLIFTTNTLEEAFRELAQGKYDAILTQRITGLQLLEDLNIKSVTALEFQIPQFRQDFCFAVQKGNSALLSRLNEGLSIVIANGTFEKIRTEWFGVDDTRIGNLQDIKKTVLTILIPVIFIFVLLWIFFLRKQVNKRTLKLNEEIKEHKQTLNSLEKQQKKLKESGEQIRLLLNSTAEGIYSIDTDGNCTLINKSALQLLGYSSREDVLGKNMHQLIHHSLPDGTPCEIGKCNIYNSFRNGIEEHRDDEVFWKANGTSFFVEYFSHPIFKSGIVTGSVVTFWDITKRKTTENEMILLKNRLEKEVTQRTAELADKVQKLDKSQRAMLYMVEDLNQITSELKNKRTKLEAANTELEAFTYSVSHDLRAPLRAINGYSRFLIEDYADKIDDDGKRFINTISENAAKMDRLITDLLNLSRVSRTQLNFSEVDMKQLATAILHETATEQEKNEFDIIIGKMPVIHCDTGLMKQVWFNIFSNALKYSSKSERKKIEAGAVENDTEVTFFVRDYGCGFDEKFKDKIFNVFQRLHRENEFQGTGVGLTIVQRIVNSHGGKVWAESVLGEGATFYFSLPKKQKS